MRSSWLHNPMHLQIVLYYPEDNEIKKRIINSEAVSIISLFWRGYQEKSSIFFTCKKADLQNTESSSLSTPKKNTAVISLAGSPEQLKVGNMTYFPPTATMGAGAWSTSRNYGRAKEWSGILAGE